MSTELATLSRTALVRAVENAKTREIRERRSSEKLLDKVSDVAGGVTAFTAAAAVGIVEGRVQNPDGTPLSLGPVPLPLAVGTMLSALSFFWNPLGQVSAAQNGLMGAYGAAKGRAWGTMWKLRSKGGTTPKKGTRISGEDPFIGSLSPEEQAMLESIQ